MKCRVKRVYNLVTPREPLVVLANCKIGQPIFLSRLLYIARWPWRHEALRHGALFVSRQHRLCCRWPGRTLMLYLWRTDGFMQCLWNNVYDRWIRSNFPCIWQRTASTTNDWKSSPAKIFHWNSSGERRLKFIGEQIEEDNCEAENSYCNVVNAATTNMYRGCDKILQVHCKRNRWREETLTVNASKSDKKISQRLKFTVKITFDAVTGSNSYTICTMHVKNIFPTDSEQPIKISLTIFITLHK